MDLYGSRTARRRACVCRASRASAVARPCVTRAICQRRGLELVDVYAAVLVDFPYRPELHVHYQESRLRIADGLPKLRDVPKSLGGSGLMLEEE